jgi:heat shock protein HslJ
MKVKKISFIAPLLIIWVNLFGQQLTPGFNPKEYYDLMCISSQFGDSAYAAQFPVPDNYTFLYRSEPMGLDNMYDLYKNEFNQIIVSVRGSTKNSESWLENFYAAQIPASGKIKLSDDFTFNYQFANIPNAAVHIGWTIGTGYIYNDLKAQLKKTRGATGIYIIGHSQGGAIAYLLAAQIKYEQSIGEFPELPLKTYCSAAPKPGNTYFAYDFEQHHRGFAFNVVNTHDWVPETPVSIQTVNDLNQPNPLTLASENGFKDQSFFKRLYLNRALKRLTNTPKKAVEYYKKYLGEVAGSEVEKLLNEYKAPEYLNSSHYVRAGETIALIPTKEYDNIFKADKKNIFAHHLHSSYLYLLNVYFSVSGEPNADYTSQAKLSELLFQKEWTVEKITELSDIKFKTQFPKGPPTLVLNQRENTINGTTGCNSYFGSFKLGKNEQISFPEPIGATRMFCEGVNEQLFTNLLHQTHKFEITNKQKLILIDVSGVVLMELK